MSQVAINFDKILNLRAESVKMWETLAKHFQIYLYIMYNKLNNYNVYNYIKVQ